MAVVFEAVLRIGRRALKNSTMVAVAAAAFVGIFFFDAPFPLVVLAAGAFGLIGERLRPTVFAAASGHGGAGGSDEASVVDAMLARGGLEHTRPSARRAVRVAVVWSLVWLAPLAAIALVLGPENVYARIGLFFSKTAMVTFGGAYSVLAYVAQQAVDTYGWLRPGEMLDGLGMAETTPGPLIMVLQFVGFLGAYRDPGALHPMLAGALGGLLATWVTFAPCFLWIFLGAPYIEALRGNRSLHAALSTITAAVVGVVLNLSIWFAIHTVFGTVGEYRWGRLHLLVPAWNTVNWPSLLIAAGALLAMLRFKAGMGKTLAVSAGIGLAYHLLLR
jgi:chromate transporter